MEKSKEGRKWRGDGWKKEEKGGEGQGGEDVVEEYREKGEV